MYSIFSFYGYTSYQMYNINSASRIITIILFLFYSALPVCLGQDFGKDSIRFKFPVSVGDSTAKNKFYENMEVQIPFLPDSFKFSKTDLTKDFKSKLPKLDLKKYLTPSFKTKGTISLGYEYGWLPYATQEKIPAGNYRAEGEVEFSVFNMPLKLNFFYTNARYNSGISNHFRLSYDVNAYKDEMLKKISEEQTVLKNSLEGNLKQQQLLEQKLLYLQNQKQQMDINKSDPDSYRELKFNNSLTETFLSDSLALNKPELELQTPDFPNDSLSKALHNTGTIQDSLDSVKGKIPYDSLNTLINDYKKQIAEVQSLAKDARDKIETLKALSKNPLANSSFNSKKDKYLSGIKKLEVGMCYPSYSSFLVNNMPVKGVNIQYEKDDWFTAFTYGVTVNNILFSPDPAKNTLENTRNLFNFFDFGNVEGGRRIVAAKTGWGSREKTHFHLGFLYGLGAASYISNTNAVNPIIEKERNLVVEVDVKYHINPNHSFELLYGKSSIKDLSHPSSEYNSLRELSFRSNAATCRYNGYLPKTKTRFILSNRLVDPFFRSFGVAYMSSDNLRYELKAEQPISSKIKYTTKFRYDEDNLLNLYSYKTYLYTWGNNLQWKVSRRITLRLAYNPVLQEVKTGSLTTGTENNISNLLISYVPKTRNVQMQTTAIYSYYNISSDSLNIRFQNFTYTQQLQFRRGFRTGISSSWFKDDLVDSLNNNALITVLDAGQVFKNGSSLTIAGKLACYETDNVQGGFSIKASLNVFKRIGFELQAERLVKGEFYNTYNLEQNINDFPYYFLGRIIYKC